MTECGAAAVDVPFQGISECARTETTMIEPSGWQGEVDVPLILSSLGAIQLSSAAAPIPLMPLIPKLPQLL